MRKDGNYGASSHWGAINFVYLRSLPSHRFSPRDSENAGSETRLAGMGYQQNSVNITHLQAIALDNLDAAVIGGSTLLRARGVQRKPTPSSLQPVHARATTATTGFARITPPTDRKNHGNKQWDTSQTQRMPSNNTLSEGDTQEAPDWADYCENQKQSLKDTGQINIVDCFEPPAEEDSAFNRDTNDSRNDGEDEDENLEKENQDGNENDEEPVDLISQDIRIEDVRAEPFPESRRFQQPITPHVAGAKRKRLVEEETPLSSTPMLPVNPFAGMGTAGMMGPSQLFRATQAQTSPLFVHSDILSERPSPNINNFGRPSTAGSLSSPVAIRAPQANIARAVTEPQGNYVSMKESQDAREQHRRQVPVRESELFDDEFELLPRLRTDCIRGKERGMANTEGSYVKNGLSSTSANHLPSQDIITMLHRKSMREAHLHRKPEVVLISDATPPSEASGNISEDETEREEEKDERPIRNKAKEGTEENKENIEVPMTVMRPGCNQVRMSQSSPSNHRLGSGPRRSVAQVATQVARSPRRADSFSGEPIFDGSNHSYVARDSLPSPKNENCRLPAPYQPHSSPDNQKVVPQSQLSQRSKILIPQSSIPSKAEASNGIVNLVLSSPFQSGEPRETTLKGCGAPIDHPEEVRARHSGIIHSSTGLEQEKGSSPSAEPKSTSTDPQNIPKAQTHMPPSLKSTIPETNSAIRANALSPPFVVNSSQEMSSSGPKASSSTSRLPARDSLNKQSPGTTVYETAQDCLSTSASRNQAQGSRGLISENSKASPSREFRRRTLNEIMGDLPPPDAASDIDFAELDPFKDQVSSSEIRPTHPDRQACSPGRQGIKCLNNTTPKREPPIAQNEGPRATTSTRWKISTLEPLEHPSSPTRPSSSAMSQLTQEQLLSFGARDSTLVSSSSSLTPPPASDAEDELLRVVSATVSRTPDLQAVRSHRSPAVDLSSRDNKKSSLQNPLADQEDCPSPEAQAQLVETSENQSSHRPTFDVPILAPDRVFAHFNGDTSAYYSATCLGVIPGKEPRYRVRYDDGAEDCINAFGIKRLEFRPGDAVKIDLPQYKTKNYLVVGMTEQQEIEDSKTLACRRKNNPNDEQAWPETDIYGHAKVLLVPKKFQSTTIGQEEDDPIAVGLFNLYFTQAMWANVKHREYLHVDHHLKDADHPKSPANHPSTPSSPSSRLKRLKPASVLQSTCTGSAKQGLFTNMAFTLTNIPQTAELERAKSLILAHGGRVLEDGLDALFHIPSLHRITSPKKSDSDRDFHPIRGAHGLGFTCLIADRHCRRAKYIQALALGIPCLATRWVSDCVTKQRLLPGSAYLLPAGESALLGGAVHSRILPAFAAETSSLSKLLDHRPQMLKGSSILLIMSKNEEESMRQYPLLMFALSPTRIARALSIEAAAKAIAEAHLVGEPWDWVFSYDREREVEKILFGNTAKKRKNRAGHGAQKVRTRVIGNEFIIQSLISGQLVDE